MDEAPEIDRIVNELKELREREGSEPASTLQLDAWLKTLIARGGSDLLLVAGAPACIRTEGAVQKSMQLLLRVLKSKPLCSRHSRHTHFALPPNANRRFFLSCCRVGPLPH